MSKIAFDAFVIDISSRRLSKHGTEVELSTRAFDLLVVLASEPGRVFRRAELFGRLWPNPLEINDGALTQTVSLLRKTLADHDAKVIRTVPKIGYAFTAMVVSDISNASSERPSFDKQTNADVTDADLVPLTNLGLAPDFANSARIQLPTTSKAELPISAIPRSVASVSRTKLVHWSLALAIVTFFTIMVWVLRSKAQQQVLNQISFEFTESAAQTRWAEDGLQTIIALRYQFSPSPTNTLRLLGKVSLEGTSEPRTLVIHWSLQVQASAPIIWQQRVTSDRLFELDQALEFELAKHGVRLNKRVVGAPVHDDALMAFSNGLAATQRQDFPSARIAFERALAISPSFAVAQAELARTLDRLGLASLATTHARQALATISPHSAARALLRFDLCKLISDFPCAIRELQSLVKQQPESIEYRLLLAQTHNLNNDPKAAITVLEALDSSKLAPVWRISWELRMARALALSSKAKIALDHLAVAKNLAQTMARPDLLAEVSAHRADTLVRIGEADAATNAAREAEQLYLQTNNFRDATQAMSIRLQIAAMRAQRLPETEYQQLKSYAQRSGDARMEGMAQATWALWLHAQSRFSDSLLAWRKTEKHYHKIGDQAALRHVQLTVVDAELQAGDVTKARALFDQLTHDTGFASLSAQSVISARILAAEGQYHAAASALDQVIEAGQTGKYPPGAAWICEQARLHWFAGAVELATLGLRQCDEFLNDHASDSDTPYWRARLLATQVLLSVEKRDSTSTRLALSQLRKLAAQLNDAASVELRMQWLLAEAIADDPTAAMQQITLQLRQLPLRNATRQVQLANQYRCIAQLRQSKSQADCAISNLALAAGERGLIGLIRRRMEYKFPIAH
jgi:DNA-binding winged helix-turn-helix (wHTH) protein